MTYEVDQARLEILTNGSPPILSPDVFARHLPLVWRRHPTVPMIQALPLTQNRLAANYPGASRQLMPFALAVGSKQTVGGGKLPVPGDGWRFRFTGANAWPSLDADATLSPEWVSVGEDLPMAALSLPGLELIPTAGVAGRPPELAAQVRLDLPYLDQVHTLRRAAGRAGPPGRSLARPRAPRPATRLPGRRSPHTGGRWPNGRPSPAPRRSTRWIRRSRSTG